LNSRVGFQKKKKKQHNVFPKPNMFVFVGENKKIQKRLRTKTICNNRVFGSLIITMVVCNNREFDCLIHRGFISIRVFLFLGDDGCRD